MKKSTKFESFEEKITNYQHRFLDLLQNKEQNKNQKKLFNESKTLYKAKRDIIKRINVGIY